MIEEDSVVRALRELPRPAPPNQARAHTAARAAFALAFDPWPIRAARGAGRVLAPAVLTGIYLAWAFSTAMTLSH